MKSFSLINAYLTIILIGYVVVAALFAIRTPAWQTPDEPAHYNYAAQIARNGCCPLIQPGDWDSAYLEQLKAARFAPELLNSFDAIQYEDHQPPLYYLLQAVVFQVSDGSLIVMRLVSATFGLGIIGCVWAVAQRLLPDQPQIGLAAAAFVAFLPQHVALLASVNNDSLAWLLVALLIWLTVRYTLGDSIPAWLFGIVMGVALLTKISAIFMVGVIGLAILLRGLMPRRMRNVVTQWVAFLLPALLLGGLWWVRNVSVYGFADVFGLREHDRIVADQLRTATFISQNGVDGYWSHALRTTFTSFWGQFGWMGLPLWDWLYTVLLIITLVLGGALLVRAGVSLRAGRNRKGLAWSFLGLCALLASLQYVYYNLEFLQLQARYMFTGLIPFGLGLALGMDTLRRGVIGRWGWSRWLTPAPFLLLAVLDVYLIWRVIPALLSP
jgi:4-amino-4-deoxy-L-arabinose transferase-like glycosyltransferase